MWNIFDSKQTQNSVYKNIDRKIIYLQAIAVYFRWRKTEIE